VGVTVKALAEPHQELAVSHRPGDDRRDTHSFGDQRLRHGIQFSDVQPAFGQPEPVAGVGPEIPEQRADPSAKQSKEQNLLDRLEEFDQSILAFLWSLDLPFTNNEAERAFRMMKVRMKISGCFRTFEGACRHARIRSYISTLRKHGLPVLEYLRRALERRPFMPQPTTTT
jgi:transposase